MTSQGFELVLSPLFSTVCFRLRSDGDVAQDRLNEQLVDRVNADGSIFIAHTRLGGRVTPRLTLGNIKTGRAEADRAWALLSDAATALAGQ